MRRWIFSVVWILLLSGLVHAQSTLLRGQTEYMVNLRSGPGTGFEVVEILQYQTQLVFVGRNQSSTWLYARVNEGLEGWLSYTFVRVEGDVNSLPIMENARPDVALAGTNANSSAIEEATLTGVIPQVTSTTYQIFQRGLEMGNRADVFSKVGDSITASNLFLDPIGHGAYSLNEYAYLQDVIDYFSQTAIRDHFSFANSSLAARGGWTSSDLLNPNRSTPGICNRDESPLACEYRVSRPAVALIMIGSNDVPVTTTSTFSANLQQIVEFSIEQGVIPVISTIPDQPNSPSSVRVTAFNDIIRSTANAYNVPLWDYWQAMQGLPNQGLSSDNLHPSYDYRTTTTAYFDPQSLSYGYNIRNLTALMVLDTLWREVLTS